MMLTATSWLGPIGYSDGFRQFAGAVPEERRLAAGSVGGGCDSMPSEPPHFGEGLRASHPCTPHPGT